MRTKSLMVAVAAASAAALAWGEASAAEATASSAAPGFVGASAWTFAKLPAAPGPGAVASPAQGVDAMAFEVTARGEGLTRVTRMAFAIKGTVQAGDVTNFQLVYHPDGLAKPGVVVGTNDGSGFSPGGATSIVSIGLTTPIAWSTGDFKGDFVLRVDVNGARARSFGARLQTVTMEAGGREQYVRDTCDLPLQGDDLVVN